MSASFAENHPLEPDPPITAPSEISEAVVVSATMRKRTILGALAVVAVGAMLAAPVDASEDAVAVAIVGGVEPAVLETSLAADGLLPVVVADDAAFDQGRQRTTTGQAALERQEREAERAAEKVAVVAARERQEVAGSVWDRLADCESGDRDRSGTVIRGTARWDYGLTFSHGDIFEGGPNFHPRTWEAFKDPGMPGHAGQASRDEQILVAERVLAAQGWGAWPVCSRVIGVR